MIIIILLKCYTIRTINEIRIEFYNFIDCMNFRLTLLQQHDIITELIRKRIELEISDEKKVVDKQQTMW